ncbi:hypothetical protein GCM10022210_03340 [Mucilaginibacter dorajii]|uniref:Uncharacterized protein n=1 Tax=Mucilaginibacter dorajii TaxID=692994 RepID=A0ABP7P4P0_9SPHI
MIVLSLSAFKKAWLFVKLYIGDRRKFKWLQKKSKIFWIKDFWSKDKGLKIVLREIAFTYK